MFAPRAAKSQTATEASRSKLGGCRSTIAGHRLDLDSAKHTPVGQRTIGNQATLRFLVSQKSPLSTDSTTCNSRPGVRQAKLTIGPADDPLEREADAVADQVMRMADPALSISTGSERIRGSCPACDTEDHEMSAGGARPIARRMQNSPPEPLLQRQEDQQQGSTQAASAQQDSGPGTSTSSDNTQAGNAQTGSTNPDQTYPELSRISAEVEQLKAMVAYAARDQNLTPATRTETAGVTWCPVDDNADLGKPKTLINRAGTPSCLLPCVEVHEQTHTDFMAQPCEQLGLAFGRIYFWMHIAKQAIQANKPDDANRALANASTATEDARKTVTWYNNYMDQTCRYDEGNAYAAGIAACNTDDARNRCAAAGQTADLQQQMSAWRRFMQNPPNCPTTKSP